MCDLTLKKYTGGYLVKPIFFSILNIAEIEIIWGILHVIFTLQGLAGETAQDLSIFVKFLQGNLEQSVCST